MLGYIVGYGLIGLLAIFLIAGIRIVRPTERGLIEKLGKYNRYAEGGFYWIIPLIERMVQVDITEKMMEIDTQEIITEDNLNAKVDLIVYYKVIEDERAVKKSIYKVSNFEPQITRLAQTTARNVIGTMPFKDVNSQRNKLNAELAKILKIETENWGVEIVRVELKDITPPNEVQDTMNQVIQAENTKRAAIDFACYSEDTKVLTENGFKYHWEVKDNEKIMCYQPKNNSLTLSLPKRLYSFNLNNKELIRFKSNNQDFLVTENHTLYVSTGKNKFFVKKANDIQEISIPELPRGQGFNDTLPELKLKADDMLEFVGYYLSEGGLDNKSCGQVKFIQKDVEDTNKIRECIRRLGFSFKEFKYTYDQERTCFNVFGKQLCLFLRDTFGGKSYEKRIPPKFLNLSQRQLKILFDALMLGDGTYDSRENRTSMAYYSISEKLMEGVQELALKLGYSTKILEKGNPTGFVNCQSEYVCKRLLISQGRDKHISSIKREAYSGNVYCFETETGFYVTLRNGCIAIQGNTAVETKADGEKRAVIKRAEGEKQMKVLVAEGAAKAYKLINESFKGNAQILKKLEVTQLALQNNAKVILTEKGITPNLIIGNLLAEK